jgi:hypothetical protein
MGLGVLAVLVVLEVLGVLGAFAFLRGLLSFAAPA